MSKIISALRRLPPNSDLQVELGFGGALPAKLRFIGKLVSIDDSYRIVSEFSGLEIEIQTKSDAWNVTEESEEILITKEAGGISTYLRIKPKR